MRVDTDKIKIWRFPTRQMLRDAIFGLIEEVEELRATNAVLTNAMHFDGEGSAALEKSSIPGDEETFNNGHGW